MADPIACFDPGFRLGILGGGQLGKMLVQAAQTWHIDTSVLDPDPAAPARLLCSRFQQGDFRDEPPVLRFGREVDLVTVEIESVHTGALEQLAAEGRTVRPAPSALACIQDKGLQKEFLRRHRLPTSDFRCFAGRAAVAAALLDRSRPVPFVQKLRRSGYDGRGVQVVRSPADLQALPDAPCVAEDYVEIEKELSVVAARRPSGEVAVFPAVEMVFHPDAHLVELLLSPADLAPSVAAEARDIAIASIEAFDLAGLLAVELFLDRQGRLWINEVAPRPHNSGHHTLAANLTSQYEQHLRAIFDLPLGATDALGHAAMVNLLGAEGFRGKPIYHGIEACLQLPGCTLHIYGKPETRPFRKMGHATLVGTDAATVLAAARRVQQEWRVTA